MVGQVETTLETVITKGIEQVHETLESTMASFLTQANVGVHVTWQINLTTIIDITTMVPTPTIVP